MWLTPGLPSDDPAHVHYDLHTNNHPPHHHSVISRVAKNCFAWSTRFHSGEYFCSPQAHCPWSLESEMISQSSAGGSYFESTKANLYWEESEMEGYCRPCVCYRLSTGDVECRQYIIKEMDSIVIVRLLLTGPCLHNFIVVVLISTDVVHQVSASV